MFGEKVFFLWKLFYLILVESPETIQSLNTWVRILEDWADSGEEDISRAPVEGPASAESKNHGGEGRESKNMGRGDVEPFFEHAMMTNISEQVDSHVFLRCRVKNLGDQTVSFFFWALKICIFLSIYHTFITWSLQTKFPYLKSPFLSTHLPNYN